MQAAEEPFGQQIAPHPSGSIGSIATDEARPNLGAELLIAAAASAARSLAPGIEPAPRDTGRPAQAARAAIRQFREPADRGQLASAHAVVVAGCNGDVPADTAAEVLRELGDVRQSNLHLAVHRVIAHARRDNVYFTRY